MIQLQRMAEAHVSQIAELEKLCFSAPWSRNSVASELNNPLSLWLVATDGDTVAGYIGSQSVMGEADMMNVAVHPDHRRKGLGEMLVLALCDLLEVWQVTAPETVQAGYYLQGEDAQSLTLEPVWAVETEQGQLIMSCITGEQVNF